MKNYRKPKEDQSFCGMEDMSGVGRKGTKAMRKSKLKGVFLEKGKGI